MHREPSTSTQAGRARPVRGWLLALTVIILMAAAVAIGPRLLAPPAPTPPCVETRLTLGSAQFVVRPLAREADGSIKVPPDTPGVAYQIERAPDYVLILSPATVGAGWQEALSAGADATLVEANCNSTTYRLAAPQPAPPDMAAFLAQPPAGLTIIVPNSPTTAGYVVTGELAEGLIKAFDTPQPGSARRLAEVSLLTSAASADGTTVEVSVSIVNAGATPFELAADDVALTPDNSPPLAAVKTEPALPHAFQPGRAETITFTFPRPLAHEATLKVMDAEFILSDF